MRSSKWEAWSTSCCCALAVGVVGYGLLGTSVDLHKPISSVLDKDVWLVIMNAGIFVHCISAYVSATSGLRARGRRIVVR